MEKPTPYARLVAYMLVIGAATISLHAQSGRSSKFLVGAYLHAKAGVNTTVAQGWKTGPALSGMPDLGLSSRYVLSSDAALSLGIDLGYNSVTYESQFLQKKVRVHEQYSSIAVFPHMAYKGFILGVSYDVPVSGNCYDIDTDKETSMLSNRSLTYADYLASVVSVKTGLRLPIYENEGSALNLDVMATYALGGMFADGRDYIAAYDDNGLTGVYNSAKNPTPAGLSIGLSYLLPVGR
ncbi:MAG: hypothetical protein ACKOBV_10860 [Candidatus Kapaibacterium sp.]